MPSALPRLLAFALAVLAAPAFAQSAGTAATDTVTARPLDGGKMWLFEEPPTEYLAATYGFHPDDAWYERARLASLRMPGCSASFVSPHGLVATNHHCAEGAVVAVDRGGEGLLDNGFYARRLADERPAPDMTMDQVVGIEDVTAEMTAAADAATTPEARTAAIEAATAAVTQRLLAARGVTSADPAAPFVVQVVALYNGGRYSAYTFRRYRDVRLVMAPELRLGAFGGDYDNFTYPRYAADFAFFRVYGDDGQPLNSPAYFPLSDTGVARDSVVFVVGNPGSTSRGLTVAELETLRDTELPATNEFIDARVSALLAYLATGTATNPDAVRAQIQSLRNSQKAFHGRLRGLQDPVIIARRRAAERDFRAASPEAGALIDRQAALQTERRAFSREARDLSTLFNPRYGSATMLRALAVARGRSVEAAAIAARPEPLERAYLAAELAQIQRYLLAEPGMNPDEMPKAFQAGATPLQ
ncbi:MAG TPA: S46 family peptidase, partial [Rubricoccaceae bacterium]